MEIDNLKEKKVGELVKENIQTAHVFKKHGIDFCCGGGISIEKACEKENVRYEDLVADLLKLNETPAKNQQFDKWRLTELTDYIIKTHHSYVAEAIPMILEYSEKVARVHGQHHPPVIEILELFKQVAAELTQHMRKEEMILFPYINKLEKSHGKIEGSPFGTVENPIHMMEAEHENAGSLLKAIAGLSEAYTTPDWACNTFKALYAKLDEFEQDLHIHVHLENNILFPQAIEMEKSFA